MSRVSDLVPAKLPDLFKGDQLVLLGQYTGEEPMMIHLTGNYLGKTRTFRFEFKPKSAHVRNAFVSRLWASRKIATLIDAIRQMGAEPSLRIAGSFNATRNPTQQQIRNANPRVNVSADPNADAKLKELTEEILRLTAEYGILTEYTAFLAREGTDLAINDGVLREALGNFKGTCH